MVAQQVSDSARQIQSDIEVFTLKPMNAMTSSGFSEVNSTLFCSICISRGPALGDKCSFTMTELASLTTGGVKIIVSAPMIGIVWKARKRFPQEQPAAFITTDYIEVPQT